MSLRFSIIVSRFNERICEGLLAGALAELAEKKIKVAEKDIYYAPGAFELPLLAQTLARTKKFTGIICLGCVIKGETAHFEFISLGTAMGLQQASLSTGVPIAFGVLTTYTLDQALLRSQNDAHNKGREAAAACLDSALTLKKIMK